MHKRIFIIVLLLVLYFNSTAFGANGVINLPTVSELVSENINNAVTNYQTWGGVIYNVKAYGAKGDGVTDDTTAIQSAINAAAGGRLFFPAGIYIVVSLSGISNIVIEGAGRDLVTIKRKANATGTSSILEFNRKTKFTIRGITFDGNKTNQTNGSNSVLINNCSEWVIEDCKFINTKANNNGYGEGLAVVDGENDTNSTTSRVENNWFESNDGAGFYINKEWFINIRGNTFKNNGSDGLRVLNYVFPPVANVSNNLSIIDNIAIGNTGSGLSVMGFITGGTSSLPIYGPDVPASRIIKMQGNTCNENGSYGIVFQGSNGAVIGNICEHNSRVVSYAGGILFSAESSICSNNVTCDNKAFGIDAGASKFCVISNNQLKNEGSSDGTSAAYINVGASVGCIVEGNNILMGGTSSHKGISYNGIDADSTGSPFPWVGAYTSIINNTIICNSNASTLGIYVARMAGNASIESNTVININDVNRAFIIEVSAAVIRDNKVFAPAYTGLNVPTVASASTMVIPDAADTLYVTGTTGISNIYTYSQNVYNQKVRDVKITNQGSGYSPSNPPTVEFTGGGGSGAAAIAEVDNGGRVIGVKMTNNGSGYTSAPTVTFTGGGGSGAAGTAIVGSNNHEGREISIMFQGALTVTDGGNLKLNGDLITNTVTVLKLRGAYGNWHEVSRSVN